MDSKFGGVRSLASSDESGKGSPGNLDVGTKVLDEAKALVTVTNKAIESLNDGVHEKGFEDMDGSANQVAEMMAWSNDFMLDMIASDLDWKLGPVEEAWGDSSGSWPEMNFKETTGNATHNGSMNQGSTPNQTVPCLKSLAKTFTPDGVLDFLMSAAKHPTRVRTPFIAEKQAELTAYNRWRGGFDLPTFEEGERSEAQSSRKGKKRKRSSS